MAVTVKLDGATYERLVATDYASERMERFDGVPVEKPLMSRQHGDLSMEVAFLLGSSLDRARNRLRINHARLVVPGRNYDIPDTTVVPNAPPLSPDELDLHLEPLSFVVEIWSPSTGDYDATVKLPGYRLRGDAEIWWLYPPERTLTRWVRRPDGGYDEELFRGGVVNLAALPGVRIDLDVLFRG
ncbi:MAG: Uma2 family endonuclease [Chloroflexia bacterium]|nr:Uma2 family endonuclease [Chloroflexia bacterium]